MTFAFAAVAASLVMTFVASSSLAPAPYNWLFVAVFMSLACIKFLYAIRVHTSGLLSFATLIWLFCFCVDSVMLANFATLTRDAITSERRDQASARAALVADIARLTADVERERPSREREIVDADVATAAAAAGTCGHGRAHTDVCQKLAALRAEAARVDAHTRKLATLKSARERLASAPEIVVYPEVHKLASMLRSVWSGLTDEAASAGLWLLVAIAVDVIPVAVIFDASRRIAPRRVPATDAPTPATPATPATPVEPEKRDAEPVDVSDAARVLAELVRAAAGGDHVMTSLRSLAASLDVSARRVSAALDCLRRAGRISVTSDNRGQRISLLSVR